MGRKRKTRWRRLSIGEISPNEEEESEMGNHADLHCHHGPVPMGEGKGSSVSSSSSQHGACHGSQSPDPQQPHPPPAQNHSGVNGHYKGEYGGYSYYNRSSSYNNFRNSHYNNSQGASQANGTNGPTSGGGGNNENFHSDGYHYSSGRFGGGRFRKPRSYAPSSSYYYANNGQNGDSAPNRPSYNQDEYTKITTPRQDVLFKKGYLSQRKVPSSSVDSASAPTTPSASTNGTPDTQSTNGVNSDYSEGYENGEAETGATYEDPVYYQPEVFTDPNTGQVFYGHSNGEYVEAYPMSPVMVAGYPAPVYYHIPYQPMEWNGVPQQMYPAIVGGPMHPINHHHQPQDDHQEQSHGGNQKIPFDQIEERKEGSEDGGAPTTMNGGSGGNNTPLSPSGLIGTGGNPGFCVGPPGSGPHLNPSGHLAHHPLPPQPYTLIPHPPPPGYIYGAPIYNGVVVPIAPAASAAATASNSTLEISPSSRKKRKKRRRKKDGQLTDEGSEEGSGTEEVEEVEEKTKSAYTTTSSSSSMASGSGSSASVSSQEEKYPSSVPSSPERSQEENGLRINSKVRKPATLNIIQTIEKESDPDLGFEVEGEPSSPDSLNTNQSVAGSEVAGGENLSVSESELLNRTTSIDEVDEELPEEDEGMSVQVVSDFVKSIQPPDLTSSTSLNPQQPRETEIEGETNFPTKAHPILRQIPSIEIFTVSEPENNSDDNEEDYEDEMVNEMTAIEEESPSGTSKSDEENTTPVPLKENGPDSAPIIHLIETCEKGIAEFSLKEIPADEEDSEEIFETPKEESPAHHCEEFEESGRPKSITLAVSEWLKTQGDDVLTPVVSNDLEADDEFEDDEEEVMEPIQKNVHGNPWAAPSNKGKEGKGKLGKQRRGVKKSLNELPKDGFCSRVAPQKLPLVSNCDDSGFELSSPESSVKKEQTKQRQTAHFENWQIEHTSEEACDPTKFTKYYQLGLVIDSSSTTSTDNRTEELDRGIDLDFDDILTIETLESGQTNLTLSTSSKSISRSDLKSNPYVDDLQLTTTHKFKSSLHTQMHQSKETTELSKNKISEAIEEDIGTFEPKMRKSISGRNELEKEAEVNGSHIYVNPFSLAAELSGVEEIPSGWDLKVRTPLPQYEDEESLPTYESLPIESPNDVKQSLDPRSPRQSILRSAGVGEMANFPYTLCCSVQ